MKKSISLAMSALTSVLLLMGLVGCATTPTGLSPTELALYNRCFQDWSSRVPPLTLSSMCEYQAKNPGNYSSPKAVTPTVTQSNSSEVSTGIAVGSNNAVHLSGGSISQLPSDAKPDSNAMKCVTSRKAVTRQKVPLAMVGDLLIKNSCNEGIRVVLCSIGSSGSHECSLNPRQLVNGQKDYATLSLFLQPQEETGIPYSSAGKYVLHACFNGGANHASYAKIISLPPNTRAYCTNKPG